MSVLLSTSTAPANLSLGISHLSKGHNKSGTIRQRSEYPETGQKRNSQGQAVKLIQQRSLEKRRAKRRSEAKWPRSLHEAEPQDLWRSLEPERFFRAIRRTMVSSHIARRSFRLLISTSTALGNLQLPLKPVFCLIPILGGMARSAGVGALPCTELSCFSHMRHPARIDRRISSEGHSMLMPLQYSE